MSTLFFLVVGVFIGWNIPQPEFAKTFQDRVIDYFRSKA